MAVQGVKGSGIGQVTDAQIAQIIRNQNQRPTEDIISDRAGRVTSGALPMAEQLFGSLPKREYDTKGGAIVGALTDFPAAGQALYDYGIRPALEIPRMAYEGIGQLGGGIGELLAQPTETRMQEIIEEESPALRSKISSDLSSFAEMARGLGQKAPAMDAEAAETQKKIEELSKTTSDIETPAGASTTTQGNTLGQPSVEEQQTDVQQTSEQQTTDDVVNPFEEILKQAMDNVASIRGEEPKKLLEDYKQEFADATGVDISGKVDKSQALMALGLSLMQNKAGRNFNVSNALSALGEAGQKAMPELAKAKSEAKAGKLAAGKFALSRLSADEQAKAARLAAAQSTVSDLLGKQQDFFSKLQLQRDEQVAATALKGLEHENAMREAEAEGVDLYTDKLTETPLFQGAPDIFKMKTYIVKGNKDAPVKFEPSYLKSLGSALPAMEASLNRKEDELKFIKSAIEQGSDVFTQSGAFIQSVARGFGINVNSELAPIKQAQILLNKIATQNTSQILGEAGKTISDGDRDRVDAIVGQINALDPSKGADRAVLLQKLNSVFELVVSKGRRNLDTAYGTLLASGGEAATLVPEGYIKAVQAADEAADLSDDDKADLKRLQIAQGDEK